MLHGDGEPLLIIYEDDRVRFCYVVMKQDIANSSLFIGEIQIGTYFDFETPYGYGGVLSDGEVPRESQYKFFEELVAYCKSHNIVSQFIRFHPLLGNHGKLDCISEKCYLRDTIFIDTSSKDIIMSNMDSKNRNMVRKAIKSGIEIKVKPISDYIEFIDMYNTTMINNQATKYYFFNEDYYEALKKMSNNVCIFFAMLDDMAVSASIMYFNDKFMHYHLAGSNHEYRKYAPNNLLLYEAACWANERGISKFHLGGGMSSDDDLFGFKKQFNKNGKLPFYVGRTIFDQEAYKELLSVRKKKEPVFDINNNYMIQYRKP